MKRLIDSLRSHITGQVGCGAYFIEVDDEQPAYPYVLLWTTVGSLESNTLDGSRDLWDRLGVTMVHTTSNNVLVLAQKVRAALTGFTPQSDTWRIEELRPPFDSQPIDRDRDVSIPGVGYPSFAVDLYRLAGTAKVSTR